MSDTKDISINGVIVTVGQPYAEGHTITAAEAKALNQTRAENIANNCRKAVKELIEEKGLEGATPDVQKLVMEYDAEYEFTLSSGTGRTTMDPLTKECYRIAREYVNGQIKSQGKTLKEYRETEEGQAKYDAAVEKVATNEKVVTMAKKNLKEREKLAELEL